MHQSALFLTLAAVALGASARVNTDTNTNTDPNAVTATINLLNPPALAAPAHRSAKINVDTDPAITRHLITVELGKHLGVQTNLLRQDKPVDVNVQKRLDLSVNSPQEGHKLINIDLNRRLDVNAGVLNQEKKPVNVDVAKRLDLNPQQGHRLINVDLNRRLDVNADVLKHDRTADIKVVKRLNVNTDLLNQENKPMSVQVAKRWDLNLDTTTPQQEHRLINVDLNRRRLDVNADLLKQDKPVNVHVAKRLDVNIDLLDQENKPVDLNLDSTTTHRQTHRLINVDLNHRFETNANVNANVNNQQTTTSTTTTTTATTVAEVNLARGRMPTALEVSRRHLDNVDNVDINAFNAKEHNLITVSLGKRLDINNIVGATTNNEGGERRLITVDLGKRLDLNVNTPAPQQNGHKLINVDLNEIQKRDFQMSNGYVLDTAKVDAATKRDLNVNVKSEFQRLSVRHKDDNDDDWEDNEEDEGETLNETGSSFAQNSNNKEAEKQKETASPSANDKNNESSGHKKNAAYRANAFTGLSIVGLLVGSAFLWA